MRNLNFPEGAQTPELNLNLLKVWERWVQNNTDSSFRFDREYVEFLKKSNGRTPDEIFFSDKKGNAHEIEIFFHYSDWEDAPGIDATSVWSMNGRFPPELIPIASLVSDNYLCFKHQTDQSPTVVIWWNHRSTSSEDCHTEFVADTFEAFLELLTATSNRTNATESDESISVEPIPLESLIGRWKLIEGEFVTEDYENPWEIGTNLDIQKTVLEVTFKDQQKRYPILFNTSPPELYIQRELSGACIDGWNVAIENSELTLEWIDPGEPGAPTWAGYPASGLYSAVARFTKL